MPFRKSHYTLLTLMGCLFTFAVQAQCAMCKGTVQTSEYARSINKGIEYMLLAPILLVAAIAFLWLKNKDKFHTREH